jgi:hypothetical protein
MYRIILVAILWCFAISTNAQSKSEIETEIQLLEQKSVNAILASDTNLLKKLWDPEFMVNNPRNTLSENRDSVFVVQRKGWIDYSSFIRIIEKMLIEENTVITMGRETFISKTDIPGAKAGQPVQRRFTNVWMKKNNEWVTVARHASVICQ